MVLRELNGECISCGQDSLGISAQYARVSEGEWIAQRVCVCPYQRHIISSLSLSGKSFYGSWAVQGPIKYVPPNPTPVHSSEPVTEATIYLHHHLLTIAEYLVVTDDLQTSYL